MSAGPVSLERLTALLDAYGAAPERWPESERESAERLIAQSDVARARWQEAAALDRVLDALPHEPPSPALQSRVLARVPRRRVVRRALAVALPLAAAAAVMFWMMRSQTAPSRTARLQPVGNVGEYTSSTDVLLGAYGVDIYATVPSVGCDDSTLACPGVRRNEAPYSQRLVPGRLRA